jgi:probable F420-dependent oxidoreductase
VRYGAVFPQLDIGPDASAVAHYATAVEEMGYDFIVAYDHVLGAHPDRPGGWTGTYTHLSQFHEPFVLYGFLAGIVGKLEFVTSIIVLPQRQTALVAKQAAEVDVLSGGRLRLGVGIGWNAVEFEALGQRFTNRGRRIEEQIALMRRLWTEEVVDFTGRWHRVDRAGLNPMPIQRPIPVWMGGGAEPALRRIARIADGYLSRENYIRPNDEGRLQLEQLRGWVREAGRDPATFGVETRLGVARGTVEDWVKGVATYREWGVTGVELNTMNAKLATIDDHLRALRAFREGVRAAGLG